MIFRVLANRAKEGGVSLNSLVIMMLSEGLAREPHIFSKHRSQSKSGGEKERAR